MPGAIPTPPILAEALRRRRLQRRQDFAHHV
jgi:hypothetical protein